MENKRWFYEEFVLARFDVDFSFRFYLTWWKVLINKWQNLTQNDMNIQFTSKKKFPGLRWLSQGCSSVLRHLHLGLQVMLFLWYCWSFLLFVMMCSKETRVPLEKCKHMWYLDGILANSDWWKWEGFWNVVGSTPEHEERIENSTHLKLSALQFLCSMVSSNIYFFHYSATIFQTLIKLDQ